MTKPASLIFINDLNGGGAQNGIATILRNGFLDNTERHLVAIIAGDGAAEKPLTQIPGLTLTVLSRARRMHVGHLLYGLLAFPAIVLRHRIRLVIGSLPQANLVVRAWSHLLPIRYYSFEHNTRYAKSLYAPLLRLTSWRVHGMLADCQASIDAVLPNVLRPHRLTNHLVPLVVLGPPKPTPNPRKGPLRLVAAARLAPVKNFTSLLKAMSLLKKDGIPTTLTLFGTGPLKADLEAETKALGVKVDFRGYAPDWEADLPNHDIYLQPSHHEGLGISLITAMNHGLASIATASGGILEYGVAGQTHLALADPTPAAIAAALQKLTTPATRARMGRAAAKAVQRRFNGKTVRAKLKAIGKCLVGE